MEQPYCEAQVGGLECGIPVEAWGTLCSHHSAPEAVYGHAAARAAVRARSGGRCELRIPGVCQGWATNYHHRQRRGVGPEADFNLLHLCGSGTTGCHGWVEANPLSSYAKGWKVHTWDDPRTVPWTAHE